MKTCILYTNTNEHLSTAAYDFASTLFQVLSFERYSRGQKFNSDTIIFAEHRIGPYTAPDYLFNFLSPAIVPEIVLQAIRIQAINFHPAPPEYPESEAPAMLCTMAANPTE